jgi:hypothetical protein
MLLLLTLLVLLLCLLVFVLSGPRTPFVPW